ncbi:hypothetical protein C6P40_001759 [Pichia californica]|uniref:DUF221-domain-containing protein n=1 Tax=Pichia californica TaxID=460514 RepID=A0A9P7BFP8_9ASCO|nr:hypothetical protein C6P40_001759 [[Candida] californica]
MSDSTATSTQDVITSIIANGVICAIFTTCFFILRMKFKRIYEPKSYCDILPEEDRPEKLPRTPLFWFKALIKKDHAFVIKHSGLDGYLFIRYIFIISTFGLGGMLLWIILFPVNATNGKGETGLNQLGISNVGSVGRYYAHVFMSWIYYSAIMFTIYRELHFYTNIRNLILSTPKYAKKLSSRVVIFQTVPDQYLDEIEFFKLFGGVKRIWVAKISRELTKKVKERENLCNLLEIQLNKLLIKSVKEKLKAEKNGQNIEPENELVCYIPQKKMPTIRLKKFIGKKVDLIEYCKEKIPKLNNEINELQKKSNVEKVKPLNSIAVEFENQYYAQMAYQVTVHDQPLHFQPKHIGVNPEDIFWPNMRLFWWEQLTRLSGSVALIIFLIIIWAIPVAFIGFISNLTYLTNKMPWLNFIYNLPDVLLGLITSLLPTVLLAILMMILPIFIRSMAKISGCLTIQSIEYFTQNAYFAFQVVQTFLVVTIASSVSSVATKIIEDPTSTMTLLSSNLPKSSNFFISYIILQGFSVSGGTLFQIVTLILFYIMSFILDGTVRKKFNRFNNLSTYSWGTVYPIYSCLAVISIVYSIISPIISLFTFVSFLLLFFTYMNTLNYIIGTSSDSVGKNYPRAIFHLMVGIYLGEVCLLGLFAVSKSWGCIVLEAIFIGITVLFHVQMNIAFDNLIKVLPNTCMRPLDGESETLSWKNPKFIEDKDMNFWINKESINEDEKNLSKDSPFNDGYNNNNNNNKIDKEVLINEPLLIEGDRTEISKPNIILRYLQPWKYLTYHDLHEYIPSSYYEYPDGEDDGEDNDLHEHDYDCPDLSAQCPTIWIPRDPMGLSKVQINQFRGIVPMSDANAEFNEKGKVIFTGQPPVLELDEYKEEKGEEEEEEDDDEGNDTVHQHFESV